MQVVVICERACYNKDMKLQKITGFVLAALMITGTAAFACAPSITADAAAAAELNTTNAELFLPESYEQYLPLTAASHIAFCTDYTAIADGNLIYIYDRAGRVYREYHHVLGSDQATVAISKVQFAGDNELYFRDDRSNLYRYDFASEEAQIVNNMSCLTFLIHGDYLYMANESTTAGRVNFTYILLSKINDIGEIHSLSEESLLASNPRLAFEDGILYCIINNNTVNAYSEETHAYLGAYSGKLDSSKEQIADLKFICAYQGSLFYSVNGLGNPANGLYQTDIHGNAKLVLAGSNFTSITSYNGKLYCMQGNSVRELLVTENGIEFTDFEIGAESSSTNRLSGAEEIVRAGNLVVTADAGNNRVTVYNGSTKSYDTVPVTRNGVSYTPDIVAADKDGAKIAVSSGKYIFMYEKTQEGFTLSYVNETSTAVTGLTFVYGECYFVTENSGYGYTDENKTEVSANYFSGKGANPSALASDLYGQIYVAFGNAVYSYTEDEFRNTAQVQKNAVLTLPAEAKSLRCDYEGNLYYLSGNGLYQNGEQIAAVDGSDFVYSQTCAPLSFALGFEDDEVYFNFGNFVVKSKAGTLESIPTLNEIDVGTAGDDAFALHENNLLVDIPAHSVGIRTDLAALKGNDSVYFPYSQYYRTAEDKRGVLLAETEDYYLVALFESDRSYSANLFRKNGGAVIADESGYRGESPFTAAYLTNAVNLYCAPCLHEALASRRIERGDKLSVLGVVTATEGDYAFVELQGGERTAVRGYVPLSYLTEANPLGAVTETYTVGTVKCGKDGVEFTAENGDKITVTGRAEAKIADNGDGTFTVKIERNGKIYTAQVTEKQIARGESDALRTSLIIILSVLAVVIVAAYVYLVPHKYYRRK